LIQRGKGRTGEWGRGRTGERGKGEGGKEGVSLARGTFRLLIQTFRRSHLHTFTLPYALHRFCVKACFLLRHGARLAFGGVVRRLSC